MVKNNGGNKAKKFARKSISTTDYATRYATEDGELYAVVLKLMGNNICEVICFDGQTRMCVIRKKFSGKRRRDNLLFRGRWILIGRRPWEITKKDKEKCDLLEVYTDFNKDMIIKNSKDNLTPFLILLHEEIGPDHGCIEFINSRESNIEFTTNTDADPSPQHPQPQQNSSNLSDSSSNSEDLNEHDSFINNTINTNDEFSDMNKLVSNIVSDMGLIDIDDI